MYQIRAARRCVGSFAQHDMFQAMLERIDTETIRYLFNFQVQVAEPVEQQLLERRRRQRRGRVAFTKANETAFAGGEEEAAKPIRNKGPRIGRNDPCPCGSGKSIRNVAARDTNQSEMPGPTHLILPSFAFAAPS